MEIAAIASGLLVEVAAWRVVATGRSVWRVLPAAFVAMGLAALWFRRPVAATAVAAAPAVAVGLGVGVALYGATRAFVAVVRGWEAFRRHTEAQYALAGEVPLGVALLLAAGVSVVGEELFWRALVQPRLVEEAGAGWGPVITWAAYASANLASASLPIVAGGVVGGAVWAALAWWSGGIAASLVSHVVWTALMLASPPLPAEAA